MKSNFDISQVESIVNTYFDDFETSSRLTSASMLMQAESALLDHLTRALDILDNSMHSTESTVRV